MSAAVETNPETSPEALAREKAKKEAERIATEMAFKKYSETAVPLAAFYSEHAFFSDIKIRAVNMHYFVRDTLPVPISSGIVSTLERGFLEDPITPAEKALLKTDTDIMRQRSAEKNGMYIGLDGLPYVFNVHANRKPTMAKLNRLIVGGRVVKFNWKNAATRPFFSPTEQDFSNKLMYLHSNGNMYRVAQGNVLGNIQTYRWVKIPIVPVCGNTKVGGKANKINFSTKGCSYNDFLELSQHIYKSADETRKFALDWRKSQFNAEEGGMIVPRMIEDANIEADLQTLANASLYPKQYTLNFTARPIQASLDINKNTKEDFDQARELGRLYRSVRLGKSMVPPALNGKILKAGAIDLSPGGDMMMLDVRYRDDESSYLRWIKVRYLKIKFQSDGRIRVRFAIDEKKYHQYLPGDDPKMRLKLERFMQSPKYLLQNKATPRAKSKSTGTKTSKVLGKTVKSSEVSRRLKTVCKPTVAENLNRQHDQYAGVLVSSNNMKSHMNLDDLTDGVRRDIQQQKKVSKALTMCRKQNVPKEPPRKRIPGSTKGAPRVARTAEWQPQQQQRSTQEQAYNTPMTLANDTRSDSDSDSDVQDEGDNFSSASELSADTDSDSGVPQ